MDKDKILKDINEWIKEGFFDIHDSLLDLGQQEHLSIESSPRLYRSLGMRTFGKYMGNAFAKWEGDNELPISQVGEWKNTTTAYNYIYKDRKSLRETNRTIAKRYYNAVLTMVDLIILHPTDSKHIPIKKKLVSNIEKICEDCSMKSISLIETDTVFFCNLIRKEKLTKENNCHIHLTLLSIDTSKEKVLW